jgi:exopolysaccharide biosynthesis polyprenyl glycosylphosphotransferase
VASKLTPTYTHASGDPAPRTPPPSDIRAGRPAALGTRPLWGLARRGTSVVALIVIDLIGLALGLYIALVLQELWHGHIPPLWGTLWDGVLTYMEFLAPLMVFVFWRVHLYAARERRGGIGQILSSAILVCLFALAYVLGSGHEGFTTFGIFPAGVVMSTIMIGLLRASYDGITRDLLRIAGVRRRALLIGSGEALERLRRGLGSGRGGIEYEFVGALSPDTEGGGLPVLGTPQALAAVLDRQRVDELIVADDFKDRQLLELADQAQRRGVKVRIAPRTTELLVQQAEYVPGQGLPLFELRAPVLIGFDWLLKRGFDLLVSGAVLIVGLPLWLLIALAIKLTSRGPVLYRSRRVGIGETEFAMIKFRTMYVDAGERQAELEAANEADGPLFKIKNDPRVTHIGRILRKLSIDEIPQVLNVLKGEMSIVGPRPLPLRDFLQLEDWHRRRYLVLPGLTGLWQVSGRIDVSFDDLVRLDFYYIENWSIWLDIAIVAKTLPAIIARRGAY